MEANIDASEALERNKTLTYNQSFFLVELSYFTRHQKETTRYEKLIKVCGRMIRLRMLSAA